MSDSDEGGLTDVVENWIYEYTRATVWTLLKNYNSDTASNNELIRGALLKAPNDGSQSDDVFLAQWMYLVQNGRDLLSTDDDACTPLEEVFCNLPLLRERFKSLDRKKLAEVERLLVEQAVLVCVEKREFSLARRVKSRLWQGDLSPAIRKLDSRLDKAIVKGSLPKDLSSFQDLISASVDLLEDLCENQLAEPYLIKMAKDEVRKRNAKKTGKNKRISIKTGIQLTGRLLKAFSDRHRLVTVEGVGFMPLDKFRSALDELQGRKDELLKSIPKLLPVLTTADTPSADTPSPVTPSAVTPSAVTPSAVTPSAATPSAATPSAATTSGSSPRVKSIRRIKRRTTVSRGPSSPSKRSTRRHDSSEPDNSTDRESEGGVRSLRKRIGVTDDTFTGVVREVDRPQFRTNPAVMVRRIPRRKWTKTEEDSLFESVQDFGIGSWAEIVEAGFLPGRSNVDLKDKWRSMLKKEARARKLQREVGRQLPVDVD